MQVRSALRYFQRDLCKAAETSIRKLVPRYSRRCKAEYTIEPTFQFHRSISGTHFEMVYRCLSPCRAVRNLVTRTGIELIRTPDAVFSKMRKSPILRRFRAMQL